MKLEDLDDGEMRPIVKIFAQAMEAKLKLKDPTRGYDGWVGVVPEKLLKELDDHVLKLKDRLHAEDPEVPKRAAVDVANLVMMIFDNLMGDWRGKSG